MQATFVLAVHSFTRMRAIVIGLGVVLAGFEFLLTQVAEYLMRTQAFGMLSTLIPEFMRSMAAGPAVLMSFTGTVSLGYFHPIVLASLLGLTIAIATEPVGEVETRFVDLALARPIGRGQVVTRTVIVLVVSGTLVLGMMMVGTWTGLACCTAETAPRPSAAIITSLAANLGMLAWCWGGTALAVAAAVKRRATASALSGVAALASFLLDYLGRVWEPARAISRLSPFHYFDPLPLISGAGLNGRNLAVLLATGTIGMAVSYVVFARRDL